MLDAAELADMRTELTASFPDDVTLLEKSAVDNGQGGRTPIWTPGVTVKGLLLAQDTEETVEGGRSGSVFRWRCLLPWGTDVQASGRLEIAGIEYECGPPDTGKSHGTMLVVPLRRVS